MLCDHSLKNKVFIILVVVVIVVVVCAFCWTIVIYFCCNVFNLNRTFILTGCREYLYISVCIWYDASFTQMKRWNADEVTLRSVLEMLFMCLCPHWDGRRWDHRERHARFCVCVVWGRFYQRCPVQLYYSMPQHSSATANRNKYTT